MERRNKVLQRMLELSFIDRPTFAAAVAEPLGATLYRQPAGAGAYFLEMVRQDIESRFGTDTLYTSGLEVDLTMDRHLQQLAEASLREGLVALDMRLGFRKAFNVVESGVAALPEEYVDPWWRQLELAPAG